MQQRSENAGWEKTVQQWNGLIGDSEAAEQQNLAKVEQAAEAAGGECAA